MQLTVQKRLAAEVMNCSPYSIRFDEERLDQVKEAITKEDIRTLVGQGAIYRLPLIGTSKVRARKIHQQKVKGRRSGHGSRKGAKFARTPKKRKWINTVRLQRALLRNLIKNEIIDPKTYRDLYDKSRGGFFRSKRHIKLYMEEHKLVHKK